MCPQHARSAAGLFLPSRRSWARSVSTSDDPNTDYGIQRPGAPRRSQKDRAMRDQRVRRLAGNTVVSEQLPAVEITVTETLAFVGELRFTLSEVAEAQAFVFVAGRVPEVGQVLIVQF